MSSTRRTVASVFGRELMRLGRPGKVVVAVSGGLDSCVLLHVARFAEPDGRELVAAHFDHRMRPSSTGDAEWVSGLCRAWGVPLWAESAEAVPAGEEAARRARYEFLDRVRRETGAELVLTAHHADDQAETVLFRVLRGTGTRGLQGIPDRRLPAIVRPLLSLWRTELEEYARAAGVSWREDPTNASTGYARNALRHRVLPDAERLVAPGARRSLVRLARIARDEEAAWESVLPDLMLPLDVSELDGGLSFGRQPLRELHRAVRARVLRALAGRLSASLGHEATRRALDFVDSGRSGRSIQLGGSLTLGVELDRCVLVRSGSVPDDAPLEIPDAAPGRGTVVLGGGEIPVSWGAPADVSHGLVEGFDPEGLRFPLLIRSRRAGDRIRLSGGTRKVKKVLLEHRVPPSERPRVPLLVDAAGDVLWIPGVTRARAGGGGVVGRLRIGIGS